MQKYSQLVLRVGLAFVFLWFGYSQVTGPDDWVRLIPEFITNMTGLSAKTFVLINGGFEIIAGILILLGIFTRVVAFLLFLHMISVVLDLVGVFGTEGLSLSATAVRDIGIATGCLSLASMNKE